MNCADFSDQEHLVLKLLMDSSNGLAAALSSRYTDCLLYTSDAADEL